MLPADPGKSLRVVQESGRGLIEASVALEMLFNKILDQLYDSSLFSNSPAIFIVYAHDNHKEGLAYHGYVRKIIKSLARIHVQILSDQSPLPRLHPRIEGTDSMRNIVSNQICLLPPSADDARRPTTTSVEKVIVCGSTLLEQYYSKPYAQSYIEKIVRICIAGADQPTTALESTIREQVETECVKDDFHHVLTELAFLEVRKSRLSRTHGMVPVDLSQNDAEEAPMRYLPLFRNTDIKLKLKSPAESSVHRLFFKLLEQIFPDNRDFIRPFRKCYNWVESDLRLDDEMVVGEKGFNDTVNRRITEAYQEYWRLVCAVMRDGKLQAYTGKCSDQVSQVLEEITQSTRSEILKWLSPVSASELHGKYHDSGTSRMQGTCDWVIQDEEFRLWHKCEGSGLLLLRGAMGAGKTYSTSRVIDWVKDGLLTNDYDEGFAYFYCNKQENTRSEPKEIVRNIIRQLAIGPYKTQASNTAVHKTVHELWLKSHGQGNLSTFAEWESCLLALIDTYPRTTIVLDALDECDISQRQDLINLLVKLATRDSHSNSVKIFVAARPDDDICRNLGMHHSIRMQGDHNSGDIEYFVRAKLSEHRRWSKLSREFQNEMVDKLLEKSGDMFLFASLQIQQLWGCNTQTALRNRLSRLPDSLSTIYEEIYHSATSDPDEKKLLDRALRWVLCSATPLTTDELLFAVSQEPEFDRLRPQNKEIDEELILVWTHSLLSLDYCLDGDDLHANQKRSPPVWRLAHQAVAEFLEDHLYCNSGLANYEAGKICLMMLLEVFDENPADSWDSSQDDFKTGTDINCLWRQDTRQDRHESCKNYKMRNTLAEYAVYAWPTHVRAYEHRGIRSGDQLSGILQKFLGKPEEGSPIYERWLKHAFGCIPSSQVPDWSIFMIRRMSCVYGTITSIRPIILACHLGIYNTLLEWWSSRSFDPERCFCSRSWEPVPDFRGSLVSEDDPMSWSLVALACVHNERTIMKHLLGRGVQVNTEDETEVPAIVAAAMVDASTTVEELIAHGAYLNSPFTRRHGHILRVAIQYDSLNVLRLLLRQRAFFGSLELESIMKTLDYLQFGSPEAMELLLDTGVDVNVPLHSGSLLIAAAAKGWESLVRRLLDHGADVNKQMISVGSRTVLEAVIQNLPHSSSIVSLLIEHGAHVNSCAVAAAWKWARIGGHEAGHEPQSREGDVRLGAEREEVLQLLLHCSPDLNETWTDDCNNNTSLLIEAVKGNGLDQMRFLLEHGADVNLPVGGTYVDALRFAFARILERPPWMGLHPASQAIVVLLEAGASLDSLEGDRLHIALAAAAFAGLHDLVQFLLRRGASPDAKCGHQYRTALGAAAASCHPCAPKIVSKLLNTISNFNTGYGFFQDVRFALDLPLHFLLVTPTRTFTGDRKQHMDTWFESACILAEHSAVWDIDFWQWRHCLMVREPDFWQQNAEHLDRLQRMLDNNRVSFVLKFPRAASDEEWSIKDARDPETKSRWTKTLSLRFALL